MTDYALIVMVQSVDPSRRILDDVVSNLEFDHRTTVLCAVVLTPNGKKVAVYDRKEAALC